MSASRISGTRMRRRWESIASSRAERGYIATSEQRLHAAGTPLLSVRIETPAIVACSPRRRRVPGPARPPPVEATTTPFGDEADALERGSDAAVG